MNTVLDDNMMLCLANGQRIKLRNEMRILFEVQVIIMNQILGFGSSITSNCFPLWNGIYDIRRIRLETFCGLMDSKNLWNRFLDNEIIIRSYSRVNKFI